MTGAAVIIVQTRQGAIVVVPKLEIEGIEAVQSCGETGVGLGAEETTDVSEAAQGSDATDLLLEAAHGDEFEAGHALDLLGERGAAPESRPNDETVVEIAAGIAAETGGSIHAHMLQEPTDVIEAAAVLVYALIDAIGAVPVLDDNAAGQEIVVAAQQTPTTPADRTHARPVAAAVIDPAIETRIETERTGTETEIAPATDEAARGLDQDHPPCRTELPRTSSRSGNSKKSRSGRRRPKHTWRLRRTPGRRACPFPAWTTRRIVVREQHLPRGTRVMDKQLTDMPLEPGTIDIGADRGATVGIGPGTASETETETEIETGTDETAIETVTVTVTAIGKGIGNGNETRTGETAAETETVIVTVTEIEIETDGPDETAAYPPAERDTEAGAAVAVGADEVLRRWDSMPCFFLLFSLSYVCAHVLLLVTVWEATETVLLLGFFLMKERRLYTLDNGGKGGAFLYLSLAKRIPSKLARKPKRKDRKSVV